MFGSQNPINKHEVVFVLTKLLVVSVVYLNLNLLLS